MHKTLSITCILIVCTVLSPKAQTSHPVSWTELVNVAVNPDNSLSKTDANGWTAGALSFNRLAPGEDGWMQFTTRAPAGSLFIGLSDFRPEVSISTITYAFYLNGNNLRIYENGANIQSLGPFTAGEELRISREGNEIKYYRNGVVVRFLTVDASLGLHADVAINNVVAVVPPVTVSFDRYLFVKPTFTYQTSALTSDGGIALEVTGGDEPYLYSWSSGETASSITGKGVGAYTYTVTDASGRARSWTYYLGPVVSWTELINLTVNANQTLSKTDGVSNWTAGAISYNKLPSGEDGWLQFTIGPSSGRYMMGFSDYKPEVMFTSLTNAFYLYSGNLYIYEKGVNVQTIGSFKTGDEMRIAREGNEVRYYRNGILIRAVASDASLELYADVAVQGLGSIVPRVIVSFDKALVVKPDFTYPSSAFNPDGGIALNVGGGDEPYTYSWSSGEAVSSIAGKGVGVYSYTVTDVFGRSYSGGYHLGTVVSWTNFINTALLPDNTITKTDNVNNWTGGAISFNRLPSNQDGWLQLTTNVSTGNFMVGFSDFRPEAPYGSHTHTFYFNGANLFIYEKGNNVLSLGSFDPNEVLRIAREGSEIKYYRNGEVVRTIATDPSLELHADAALYSRTAVVPLTTVSFDRSLFVDASFEYVSAPEGSNGGISLAVTGGDEPYSYTWNTGEQTSSISSKPVGRYEVTVEDAAGRSRMLEYYLGAKVLWTELRNVQLNADNTLTKAGTTGWNASAISVNRLAAGQDGWIQFGVSGQVIVGISNNRIEANYTSMTHAVYFSNNNLPVIFENGGNVGSIGVWRRDDIYRISREGNEVKYYRNGIVVRTVTVNPSIPLNVDFSINTVGSRTPLITTSFLVEGLEQTFYARINGNWTSPETWSLTEGGAPASSYPSYGARVVIKGHGVFVNNRVYCSSVEVLAIDPDTFLRIDGPGNELVVTEEIKLKGENNHLPVSALMVQNSGKVSVGEE